MMVPSIFYLQPRAIYIYPGKFKPMATDRTTGKSKQTMFVPETDMWGWLFQTRIAPLTGTESLQDQTVSK